MADPLLIARHDATECLLLPGLANRHGLITGATGTGKTVTLQTIAEKLSGIGVPVFMADVKGDLTGISQPGTHRRQAGRHAEGARHRAARARCACPVTLWDVFGEQGHPVRATVSDMGPLLLGRMLDLNDTQAGVLNLVFKIADDNGLLLLDLKDLRAMLQHVGENASQFTTEYGNVSAASVGAIQRGLLQIESQGGDKFFGEPMLNIEDFMQTVGGKGVVNILAADKLMNSPRLYATFLLWMLSRAVRAAARDRRPGAAQAGVLLRRGAPAVQRSAQGAGRAHRAGGAAGALQGRRRVLRDAEPAGHSRLGAGPAGNRVQHALRAFTPRDQKAVKATATTMRQKPGLDIEAAITELAVGEALVSFLDAKGRPSVTERVFVLPPGSQLGPITPAQRQALMAGSLVAGVYEKTVDRESAYEKLKGRAASAPDAPHRAPGKAGTAPAAQPQERRRRMMGGLNDLLFGTHRPARRQARRPGADHGQVGRAHHGHHGRPGDPARRAGRHLRRQEAALSRRLGPVADSPAQQPATRAARRPRPAAHARHIPDREKRRRELRAMQRIDRRARAAGHDARRPPRPRPGRVGASPLSATMRATNTGTEIATMLNAQVRQVWPKTMARAHRSAAPKPGDQPSTQTATIGNATPSHAPRTAHPGRARRWTASEAGHRHAGRKQQLEPEHRPEHGLHQVAAHAVDQHMQQRPTNGKRRQRDR